MPRTSTERPRCAARVNEPAKLPRNALQYTYRRTKWRSAPRKATLVHSSKTLPEPESSMTPNDFIIRWQNSAAAELGNSQSFLPKPPFLTVVEIGCRFGRRADFLPSGKSRIVGAIVGGLNDGYCEDGTDKYGKRPIDRV